MATCTTMVKPTFLSLVFFDWLHFHARIHPRVCFIFRPDEERGELVQTSTHLLQDRPHTSPYLINTVVGYYVPPRASGGVS
jgi:hypothetical protein